MKKTNGKHLLRRAKIVCTLGPASNTPGMIRKLADAGMDVVRLNFSHGTHEEHARLIKTVRDISRRAQRPVSIIADLQGPKIRTGRMENGPVTLNSGGGITLSTAKILGNSERVGIDYKHLHEEIKKGDRILVDDGLIELRVARIKGREIKCEVINGGVLHERKGINLPGVKLRVPSIDAKDKMDLAFALKHEADYIAVSFVREAVDVQNVARIIKRSGSRTGIIAKIEKAEGVDNIDDILRVSNGLMVARGDLGVEMNPEKVPPAQKHLIRRAREFRLPVITATQMLDSMTRNPRPTRAEASDVANAVFDGTSAVMLSNETASGKYPLESVKMMDRIIREAEAFPRENERFLRRVWRISIAEAIAQGVCNATQALPVKCIAVFTETGRTARLLAHFRPGCPIIAFSPNQKTRRLLALLWGVLPRRISRLKNVDEMARIAEWRLVEEGLARKGDIVGIVAGTPLSVAGSTNMVKLHVIGSTP
jgi:pyruvate kinase